LDANRDSAVATCGNEFAGIALNEFHGFIDSAKASVTSKAGKGISIDLHGHAHVKQRLELGYLLTPEMLRYPDSQINTAAYKQISSIRSLIYSNSTNLKHSELLRGTGSLGSLIAAKGFPAVPSFEDPWPLAGDPYFSGAYITVRHGSSTAGSIDAIQIECNQGVRFVASNRKIFAASLGEALLEFLTKHYFPDLPQTYCNVSSVPDHTLPSFGLYPNPVSNRLNFSNPSPSEVHIYNMMGQELLSKVIQADGYIDLASLGKGIYLVSLQQNGNLILRKKIIRQ
jgi:hypothetical protein